MRHAAQRALILQTQQWTLLFNSYKRNLTFIRRLFKQSVKMAKKRKGRAKKNNRNNKNLEVEMQKAPHSFVFSRGQVGTNVHQLTVDVRQIMEPYTATNLKVRKGNSMRDFVAVSSPLGVTHMIVFTKSLSGINMKISRLPQGPTISFKVLKYCLKKDVTSAQARPKPSQGQFKSPPLLVLNNFAQPGTEGSTEIKLCRTMLQNMLPSLNINRLSVGAVQRCVLFKHDTVNNCIEARHYNIARKAVNLSNKMDRLVDEKKTVPDLSQLKDISELLTNDEPGEENQAPGKENTAWTSVGPVSAVGLTELGPRLTLQLYKIQSGLCDGEVLFHSFEKNKPKKTDDKKPVVKKPKPSKVVKKSSKKLSIKSKRANKK